MAHPQNRADAVLDGDIGDDWLTFADHRVFSLHLRDFAGRRRRRWGRRPQRRRRPGLRVK
jgi:hypothetical protein